MISSQRALAAVFCLIIPIGFLVSGCSSSMVNTDDLKSRAAKRAETNPKIVHLGNSTNQFNNVNFGPSDVSFEFASLR